MKRIFDFFFSVLGIILLAPFLLLITIMLCLTSKGYPFYKQVRVGQHNRDFMLFKFRTMYINSDKLGLLTIGNHDSRITPFGAYLRKYKLDELPQLFNVFLGDMSLVGPRPEVRRYVDLYQTEEHKVLKLKPGITDMASIIYRNENEILKKYDDPEEAYIKVIMPNKIKINLEFSNSSQSVIGSVRIIALTIIAIFKS